MAKLGKWYVLRLPGGYIAPFNGRPVVDAPTFVDRQQAGIHQSFHVVRPGGRVATEKAVAVVLSMNSAEVGRLYAFIYKGPMP